MKFGYVIIQVPDVSAALGFFKKAFGIPRRFVHESGDFRCPDGTLVELRLPVGQ